MAPAASAQRTKRHRISLSAWQLIDNPPIFLAALIKEGIKLLQTAAKERNERQARKATITDRR